MSKKFTHQNKQNTNSKGLILYGRHAVMSAIQNPQRKIQKLVCTSENAIELKKKYPNLNLVVADKKDIDKLLPPEAVHQGYALYCSELESLSIEELCQITAEDKKCNVLILDQVTDPQNIGAIIRSCAAFGTKALIVQDKNSPTESGAMAKAAAGTMEFLPVVRVTNLARAIETLKKNGFWVVGMDGYAKDNVDKIDKNAKLAVIMGSEGSGMRRLIEESCDITVRLPINEKVESLNVSTAAAVVLYELSK
ncbi:MAG: 23S rRNA (guanosine(2251)-2'-O)-methyltransferase RlmB [Alphaproteobacteria bacterium]|nr:23S rRNA (guanosine(2251)-2'-O)-methyltransferase RlmB [Alphaproteobacteria bacterium]